MNMILCWLIPLLVGAICGYLGYLMGKRSAETVVETIDNSAELKLLKDENARLKFDLENCNKKVLDLETTPQSDATLGVANSMTSAITEPTFNATLAKNVFGKTIKKDDLKIVEGIGPKIEALFNNFNIKTWKDLAEASVEKCQEVLDSGGERYRLHNPESWPMQARMAYNGEWEALLKWQDEHDGGKF